MSAGRIPNRAALMAETVELMKAQIIQDIDLGYHLTARTFGDLHDERDANCYGGFCDDDGITDVLRGHCGAGLLDDMPEEVADFFNEAQTTVHVWIASGGLVVAQQMARSLGKRRPT